jgi:hypothetical protein
MFYDEELPAGYQDADLEMAEYEREGNRLAAQERQVKLDEEQLAPTGHVIGAVYRSRYWGGTYKVIGPNGPHGVEVECVEPGGGAHQTVGCRWTHSTMLDKRDERVS